MENQTDAAKIKKKREINNGRGDSKNKENLKKLEAYLKLHDDIKPDIQDNRGLRKRP